jgi:DNA-binding FadR family transcriptional regulator
VRRERRFGLCRVPLGRAIGRMSGVLREVIREAVAQATAPRTAGRRARKGNVVELQHPWIGMCKDGPPTAARLADDSLRVLPESP